MRLSFPSWADNAAIHEPSADGIANAARGVGRNSIGVDISAIETGASHRCGNIQRGMWRAHRNDVVDLGNRALQIGTFSKSSIACTLLRPAASAPCNPPDRVPIAAQRCANGRSHFTRVQQ